MIPVVVGSSPIGHPNFPRKWQRPPIDCGGTPGKAFNALVSAALAHMAANVAGAIHGRDPEYLHQLRVGIRRLRTVLRIFKARRIDQRLRKLAQPLGAARDWDVFVARFGRGKPRQRAAQARGRRILQSAEFKALLAEARRCDAGGKAPLRAFAARALDRLHRKALKRARGIDWRSEKQRHRVRIAVRRLRYACDFFAPCFGDARRYLRGLADLQELLGELNDIAVARRFGAIELARKERALISELAPAWSVFEERPRFWADTGRPLAVAR